MGGITNPAPRVPEIICIFGSGNATEDTNFICHARCNTGAKLAQPGDLLVLYGCQQPGRDFVEAATMLAYLCNYLPPGLELHTDNVELETGVKSVAETVIDVVEHYALDGRPVVLVINWPYAFRVRRLLHFHLRHRWGRLGVAHAQRIRVAPCGGTFMPYVRAWGVVKATRWWLVHVLRREVLANLKAYADPHDEWLNQARTGFSWATTRQALGLAWYRLTHGAPKRKILS